jgi:hypothetical protein
MARYRDPNPVEHNMRQLIRKKLLTYPGVRTQIVDAKLQEHNGKLHVLVASVRA